MSAPGFDPAIAALASAAQRAAADPRASVFVEANAGSGKTRVLVDRVARLLLEGVSPDRILCVTFTKAAAGEMQTRLFRKLGDWSVMGDEGLQAQLKDLTGEDTDTDPRRLAEARKLFARALETPGGLKIQTLHAFCDSLLRQFPLEAGLPPGFSTQEDAQSARVRLEAERAVYLDARRNPAGRLARAIEEITVRAGPTGFEAVFRKAAHDRHRLSDLFQQAQGDGPLIAAAARLLGIDPDTDEARLKADFIAGLDIDALQRCADALAGSSKSRSTSGAPHLYAALEAARSGDTGRAWESYCGYILTAKRDKVTAASHLYTGDATAVCPELIDLFGPEGSERARMEAVLRQLSAARLHVLTSASLTLARAFITEYERLLARERAVDFADLVVRASRLLGTADMAAWVRYKLDGGLDHILVDEAQDTAPEQWDVIDALSAEFFAGEGRERAAELARTVFCVGDEKQSIYSFQNADPARFIEQGTKLAGLAEGARLDFVRPELKTSFRSAPEVLGAVDLAFADIRKGLETKFLPGPPDTKLHDDREQTVEAGPATGTHPFMAYRGHEAARRGTPGCVEIWPITPRLPKGEEDSLDEEADGPVDKARYNSPRNQLAEAVATEIARIIERGDTVWDEKKGGWERRAATPGDIVILVRQRSGLFSEIIRQLKIKDVPVAGADRMVLPEQLVVQDMLSLARFALQPGDDLALAEVLKGPVFHPLRSEHPPIDEDVLFRLAHDRKATLWEALQRSDDPALADAKAALMAVRARVDTLTPYAFFARFLSETSDTGESRAARIYARLREEARDPLEEFLSRAIAHEREGAPSLARFVDAITRSDSQLKRDPEGGRDEVRVMTVHAAKGLEAPIVFLPDTTSPPSNRYPQLEDHEESGLIWSENDAFAPDIITALREGWKKDQENESARLLYVAMTRARDRLVVCGHAYGNAGKPDKNSWYVRLASAWQGDDWRSVGTAIDEIAAHYEWESPSQARRYGVDPRQEEKKADGQDKRVEKPAWLRAPAPPESIAARAIAPSRLLAGLEAGAEPAGLSPLADGGRDRFRRGTLVHKLLQILPDIAAGRRDEAAAHFLARQPSLSDDERGAIARETLTLIDHPQFAALFGPGSRAEVSLSGTAPGLPPGVRVNGQVDRLLVTPEAVLVVDFKTNRPPPADVADVAPAYLAQMGAYRALLRALYPGRRVDCALVWTDAARLMALPDAAMDAALELAAQPGALDRGGAAS
ncbi:double-strand break repair helicase AddA [Glycocaulis sp.]|uniref:double-strand break repair helicase AddA n=1 Tax=Glycocaulis sp. TaxID=1969725 RepID=UPI003D1CBD1F